MTNQRFFRLARIFKQAFACVTLFGGFQIFFTIQANAANSYPFIENSPVVNFDTRELNLTEIKAYRDFTDQRNSAYDQAFSYSAELCAGSIWQKRFEGTGGTYGHTFMILRGACLKKKKDGMPIFPHQLEFCENGVAGISTDYVFTNIQWLGTEGRNFMLYGNHPADKPFNKEGWRKIQKDAIARGTLNGVQYTSQAENEYVRLTRSLNRTDANLRADWTHDEAIGTDFAVGAARGGIDCTRIPLVGARPEIRTRLIRTIISELNTYNKLAEKKGFIYNGTLNNCSTNAHNALASIGFWRRTNNTGQAANIIEMLARKKDIVSPFDDMLAAFKIGSEFDVRSILRNLRKNPHAFQNFKANGWLPQQFGTLLEIVRPLEYRNEIFDTRNRTYFASLAFELWNTAKNLLPVHPPGLSLIFPQPQSEASEFRSYVQDSTGPEMNLISNLQLWKIKYSEALKTLNEERQDEVVKLLTDFLSEKLSEIEKIKNELKRP